MGQAARRGAAQVMRALQFCQRGFRRKIPAITILHPSRAVSSAASGIFAAAMKFEKIPIICGGFATKRSLRRVGKPGRRVGEDGRGAVARLEQRGAFRACRFYEKFARHRIVHGTPLQRERAPAPCFSRAGAAPHRAPPFLASAAPSLARLLALRMPMAGTPGETDQNRGPRPA
jgi:hypothetical protein